MAIFALTNAKVTVNSVDLSAYVKDVTFEADATALDATAMASAGAHVYIGGLTDGKFDLTLNEDFAASKVSATFYTIYTGNAPVSVVVVPVNTTLGTTNPSFTFNVFFESFPFVAGKVGDVAEFKTSGKISGAVAIAYA